MIKQDEKTFDIWSVCPDRRGLVSVGRVLDLALMAALAIQGHKVASRRGPGWQHYLRGLLDDQSAASGANR
jgi:hypothetical protein